jgi:hypothetical protein
MPSFNSFWFSFFELWKGGHGHIISQDASFLPVCEWHTGGLGGGGGLRASQAEFEIFLEYLLLNLRYTFFCTYNVKCNRPSFNSLWFSFFWTLKRGSWPHHISGCKLSPCMWMAHRGGRGDGGMERGGVQHLVWDTQSTLLPGHSRLSSQFSQKKKTAWEKIRPQ